MTYEHFRFSLQQWIQNERIIDMGETLGHFEFMEDIPRMPPTNTSSSPVSSNTSLNGRVTEELAPRSRRVTEELKIGEINAAVDEDETLWQRLLGWLEEWIGMKRMSVQVTWLVIHR